MKVGIARQRSNFRSSFLVAGEGELVHRIGVRSHGLDVPAPELEREAAPLLPSTMVVLSFGF
jgi:hypothetical protein